MLNLQTIRKRPLNFERASLRTLAKNFLFGVLLFFSGCISWQPPNMQLGNVSQNHEIPLINSLSESAENNCSSKKDIRIKAICEQGKKDEKGKDSRISPETCKELGPSLNPRVHTIGTSPVLVFDPKSHSDGNENYIAPVKILVQGRDFNWKGCVEVGVALSGGTIPAVDDKDFTKNSDGPPGVGAFEIELKPRYLKRLKTGDQLVITVIIEQPIIKDHPVAYATRTLTVYHVEDYRKQILGTHVPAKDFEAFPLAKQQAEQLFGPLIANNFFVVRLSIRNTTNMDRLISTGMMRVFGQVLVEPHPESNSARSPRFTLPIGVMPESLEQVYAILDDEEVDQGRPTVFRVLEFIGTLATSATTVITGAPIGAIEGAGLYTGTGIPALKKLWPNRWPGYERNLVEFGMPNLTKIPKNGAIKDHKFIFFSKNTIEGLITDQRLYGAFDDRQAGYAFGEWKQPTPPSSAVISLRFDAMEIPFENVFAVPTQTFNDRLRTVRLDLDELKTKIETIESSWMESNEASILFNFLSLKNLMTAKKNLKDSLDKLKVIDSKNFKKLVNVTSEKIKTFNDKLKKFNQSSKDFTKANLMQNSEIVGRLVSNELTAVVTAVDDLIVESKGKHFLSSQGLGKINGEAGKIKNWMVALKTVSEELKMLSAKNVKDLEGEKSKIKIQEIYEVVSEIEKSSPKIIKVIQEIKTVSEQLIVEVSYLSDAIEAIFPGKIRKRFMLSANSYALDSLSKFEKKLKNIDRALTRGASVEKFNNDTLDKIEDAVFKGNRVFNFYQSVAELADEIQGEALGQVVKNIGKGEGTIEALKILKPKVARKLRLPNQDLGILDI